MKTHAQLLFSAFVFLLMESGQGQSLLYQEEADPTCLNPVTNQSSARPYRIGGDVNFDGIQDYIVDAGCRLEMHSGADGSLLWQQPNGNRPYPQIHPYSDWNGDGAVDFLVAFEDSVTVPGQDLRIVELLSGIDGVQLWELIPNSPANRFNPSAVSAIGDINQDGIEDFALGNSNYLANLAYPWLNEGAVVIFSGADRSVLRTVIIGLNQRAFGSSLAGVGDATGDGIPDLLVTAPRLPGQVEMPPQGRIYLISGATGQTVWWQLAHQAAGQDVNFPGWIKLLDDLDGDGVRDFLVGAYRLDPASSFQNQLEVRSTRTGALINLITQQNPLDTSFPGAIVPMGDLDGNGDIELGLSMYFDLTPPKLKLVVLRPATGEEVWRTYFAGLGVPSEFGDINGDGADEFFLTAAVGPLLNVSAHQIRSGGFQTLASTSVCSATPNSSGAPATLRAVGMPSANSNNVSLLMSNGPPDEFGYFLCGQGQGLVPNPGGSMGNLCLGGGQPIARLKSTMGTLYDGYLESLINLTQIPEPPSLSRPILAGEAWTFQAWFRDGTSSNFSEAISVVFQ